MPDPLNAAVGDPYRLCETAHAPMRFIRRFLVQRHMHHLIDLLGRQWLDPRWAGRVPQQPVHPLRYIAAAPPADREQALAHGRLRHQPFGGQQNDPRPPDHLLRRVSVADQPLQSLTISCTDLNPLDFPHRRRLAGSRRFVNRLSATEH